MTTMHARHLVDLLVEGLDSPPLGASANRIPILITEAWGPDKEAEVIARAKEMGYAMVDHCVSGDYDLVLWHSAKLGDVVNAYVVSINNADHNPLSDVDQVTKYHDTVGRVPMAEIVAKLKSWVEKYGRVVVGSHVKERNDVYRQILRKRLPEFSFSPWYNGDYNYGFQVAKKVL